MKNYIFILLIIAIACKGGKTETDNFLEEHFTDGFINMQGEKIDIELLEGKVIIFKPVGHLVQTLH